MGVAAVVEGVGALADAVRAAVPVVENATTIVVPEIAVDAKPFAELTDSDFDAAWEQPMQATIEAFQRAHQAGHKRVIALVPTIGMSGCAQLAHAAATAEAVRVLVKSAARQWGAQGITVNCIAAAPALFGIDPEVVGSVSIAPAALATSGAVERDLAPLIALLASDAAHHITGATLTADGGVWMAP